MTTPARRHENYGNGEHVLDASEEELIDAAHIRREFVRVFSDRTFKPPVLPAAAFEVMELSKRPQVSFEDVQRIVEKDLTLAGRVLQVAQSPLYATRVKARTLRDAVQRLGLNNIRDIVWQVALEMRVFRARGFDAVMKSVQRHSVATAYASRIVCELTPVSADYAFLCGLMHELGVAGLLIALAESNRKLAEHMDTLWPLLDEAHAEAGAYLTRSWKLDADLVTVVEHHHAFDPQRFPHPLVAVLVIAERLVIERGFGALPGPHEDHNFDRLDDHAFDGALAQLGLTENTLHGIEAKVDEVLEKVQGGASP